MSAPSAGISPVVSVVLVTYNSADVVERALDSLAPAFEQTQFECVVVDNASRDDSVARLRRHSIVSLVIENRVNVGFARANNQALPLLGGSYVLLLNPDAVLQPRVMRNAVDFMEERPQCGILGAKLVDVSGALQPSCRYFPTPLSIFVQRAGLRRFLPSVPRMDDMLWPHDEPRKCDWVPGCFYLVRKQLIDEIGLFDPRYFLYCEEMDHCLRAKRAGWDVFFHPGVAVMHIGGDSARSDAELTEAGRQIAALQTESELLYFRKNHGTAAVWRHALLMTLATLINVVKGIVKRHSWRAIVSKSRDAQVFWSTFARTAWGARSTR